MSITGRARLPVVPLDKIYTALQRLRELQLRILMHLHGAPGFVSGMANILQRTLGALGTTRNTNLPPMPDDLVRKQRPLRLRNHLH